VYGSGVSPILSKTWIVLAVLALASPARAAAPSSYVMLMLGEPTVEGDLAGTELVLFPGHPLGRRAP